MPTFQASAAATQIERRMARRYPYDAVLEMDWASAQRRGHVRNTSAMGMFIEVSDSLWVGANFSAQLAIEPPLCVDCVVRRVEPGRGVGVTFFVPEEEGRARLTTLLETLARK